MRAIYELPPWLLCVVLMIVSITFGLIGVNVVRRRGWMFNADDNETAGFAHAFVGVLYAVALGLIVVGVQSGYAQVESVTVREASLASDLYRNVEGMSEPRRSEIQDLTRRYVDSVIDKEWPAVARGEASSEPTWALMDSILWRIVTYEPQTQRGELVYPEVLSRVNELVDQRRERLYLGTRGVGNIIWSVVLIGAFIIFSVAWFFNTPSAHAHYALVTSISAMFGLMIFLLVAMDHPLWGTFSVQPDAFRAVQRNIIRWDHERTIEVRAPSKPL